MNLLTQHLELPSHRFVSRRAHHEARLGVRLRKLFCDEPAPCGPSRAQIDALLSENLRLRAGVQEARRVLAKAYGDE